MEPHYPFSAVVGQQRLKTALLLAAVDPRIGGVLIEGPRGTAKSTMARALADLLPEGSHRFVTLPLGASEERVVGSIDLEKALTTGEVGFSPGLLHAADQGVLYVDEVNLLPDHLVDLLLDVAASGENVVERDGVSHRHPARIVLVGTMNPDEGELRPQLLDRFGLAVALSNPDSSGQRMEIVRRRLAFDDDPEAFLRRFEAGQEELRAAIAAARGRLARVDSDDRHLGRIAELCQQAGVEGVRADIVMLRAARAHAALRGGMRIEDSDIDYVADLVLHHRRGEEVMPPRTDVAPPPPPPGADPNGRSSPQSGDWGVMPPVSVTTGATRTLPRDKKKA